MAGNEVTIVVTGRDRTGTLFSGVAAKADSSFARVRSSIRGHMDGAAKDADSSGKSIGSKLMSSIGSAVSNGANAVVDGLSSALQTAGKAGGPILIGVLGGVLVAAGPAIGAALGGAIVLGLGAGFVGLGAVLLLQNEKIKAEFSKTGNEIKAIMTDASKPLVPVFREAMNGVKTLVKEFNPIFKEAFKDAEVPLKDFTKNLLDGFRELKPAVQPIMSAFTDLLGTIGPQLKGVFQNIAGSLTDLSRVVSENKTAIATVFVGLLNSIPAVISGISGLISFFGTMIGVVNNVNVVLSKVFVGATTSVLSFVEKLLGGLRTVAEVIGNIPGMEKFSQSMVAGLDQAIGKVQQWKKEAQDLGKAVELKANIVDLTQKIDQAKAKLNDPDLTKERRAQLNADIAKLEAAKTKAVMELGDPKLVAEYKSSIVAEIGTLQSRLATARKELKDPELTKERKAELKANIANLEAGVARAKAALASVQSKTVTIAVNTIYNNSASANAAIANKVRAHGGITGAPGRFQTGGLSGVAGELALVGEQGPELVRLPFGSTVVPAGQTRNMLAAGGQGGGLTVNLYVQGSIHSDRDIVRIIRDEFNNGGFRGALSNA